MNHLKDRRSFLALCSGLGLGSTLFPGILWTRLRAEEPAAITPDLIGQVADMAGLTLTQPQLDQVVRSLNSRGGQLASLDALRKLPLVNSDPPAVTFDPVLPGMPLDLVRRPFKPAPAGPLTTPKNIEDVAFFTVRQLGELLRTKKISSVALTTMYLERLRRYDPVLHFVITYTDDRAMTHARDADRAIAAGKYLGPLHGIPWGAKDLLAAKGYKTTWGAQPYEDQTFDEDAAAVQRLDAAGAILIAKLSLGALAQDDVWFGGQTKNPWLPSQGSSGSSAGPASATAAGCVGFSIGSETLGSISSPSTRCGVTGLRPTFGRVDRSGAMTLSWTQDKLGPLCRSVEDCVLVLRAIAGPMPNNPKADRTVIHDVPLNWDVSVPLRTIRVGYVKAAFDAETAPPGAGRGGGGFGGGGAAAGAGRGPTPEQLAARQAARAEAAKFDNDVLDVLRGLGVTLTPVTLPVLPPSAGYGPSVEVEAAAAFDDLTKSGRDKLMEAPVPNPSTWPNTFRVAHFYPGVDFINADRIRLQVMYQMEEMFHDFDVIVTPTNGSQLTLTNLSGHPAVIQPNGYRSADGTPVSITFLGKLFGEERLCLLADAYQRKAGFYKKHPDMDAVLKFTPAAATEL